MDTFCVLPWYSLELPANSPCCLLPNDTNIDQVKKDLLTGVKSPACTKCWQIESRGEKSRRQLENEFLDYKLDRDLELIKQDCTEQKNQILMYQITTSNLCNQACVSCGSGASTKWAEIEIKMGLPPKPVKSIDLFSTKIDYHSAKRISLLGGEPFFDPKTFEILKQLVDHDNCECFVSLITNGSIQLKQQQLDLLAKFKNLNICISVDGIGPVFEYLRWPAKWTTVCDNIELFRTITPNLSISYTISSLNIFYYQETIDWFHEQKLRYNHNIVTFPTWLSLNCMPLEIKKLITDNTFAKPWLTQTETNITLKEYFNKIQQQDQAKKINISQYLPELCVIFDTLADPL
jgi:hypothetical protein